MKGTEGELRRGGKGQGRGLICIGWESRGGERSNRGRW